MKYSIVITTYNREKYINKCLDSIINQTIKNFKVIIIDDGSTDNTKEIAKEYQKKHKYIEYYYKKNTGVADSRNYGIKKVDTPYFLFVDSDDYISPDLMETIEKYNNYEILSFKAFKVKEDGSIIEKMQKEDFKSVDGQSYLRVLTSCASEFIYPWGYVYKKEFWNKYKFKYSKNYVLEDTGLTPIILINAETVISINYYGYYYVQSSESIMRDMKDEKLNFKNKCLFYQYDFLIRYLDKQNFDNEFNRQVRNYFAFFVLYYGSTLPSKHLNNFIKELKKREIYKYIISRKKRMVCKISYKLYYRLSKILNWNFGILYSKIEDYLNELHSKKNYEGQK